MKEGLEDYTSVARALRDVLRAMPVAGRSEGVSTLSAMGRVAAKDVVANLDSPEHPLSHMDGYAVSSRDFGKSGKARLKVVGESDPESPARVKVRKGEAVRVSTGSRVPDGADAVVPVEAVKEGPGWVEAGGPVEPGSFVYGAGSDYRKGERLIFAGRRLRAQDVAMLLGLGIEEVAVRMVPRVAILATGSELRGVGEVAPGKVLNTHGTLFANMVRSLGCLPTDRGVVRDDPKELVDGISSALDESDVVLTLGGTSVGRRDLVAKVVKGMGPSVFHHLLKMDRGRVSGIAVVRGKPVVMLPGPAQGAMNAFLLLAVPVIEGLRGGETYRMRVRARLTKNWEARRRFRDFTKVVYASLSDGKNPHATLLAGETESMAILVRASGYVVVPESVSGLRRGRSVDVNLIPGLSNSA